MARCPGRGGRYFFGAGVMLDAGAAVLAGAELELADVSAGFFDDFFDFLLAFFVDFFILSDFGASIDLDGAAVAAGAGAGDGVGAGAGVCAYAAAAKTPARTAVNSLLMASFPLGWLRVATLAACRGHKRTPSVHG